MRALFHSPTGRSRLSSLGAMMSYSPPARCDAIVLSGWRTSSSTWYSKPSAAWFPACAIDSLRYVVFHAAVRAWRHAPLEGELEVAKGFDGHEVPAGRRLSVGLPLDLCVRNLRDRAINDAPVRSGHAVVAKPAPSGQRRSIEQKPPAIHALG